MAGTLSIVATPIGHLDDITLRALSVLRTVDLIAAEDTRRTGKLLAHFGIETRTVSFHDHNLRSRLPVLLTQLKAGRAMALVSDAGTPVLSDPGLELVQACIAEGIAVDPIPGASAPLTLAVVSGFDFCPWTIYGFPPSTGALTRNRWFAEISRLTHTVTFLEAPHRILRTLTELELILGDRPIAIGRELTKLHQTVYRGTVSQILAGGLDVRGEFTVMLGPAVPARVALSPQPPDEELAQQFGEITAQTGAGRRVVVKQLAQRFGLTAKQAYAAVERGKRK
jgi:16S rRNA (cytidine1402-2'-O)-methyltransferase